MSRFLVVLTLIGTLLGGQTFCCCTARLAAAMNRGESTAKAKTCCCCDDGKDCHKDGDPAPCPCQQKRPPVNIVTNVAADGLVMTNLVLHVVSAIVPEPVVCVVPLLERRDAWEQVQCGLPRRDRVALAQSLLC